MKVKSAVIIGVGTAYGMFMVLAVLVAVGMLDDSLQGHSLDDFRPLAFVGVGALSAGAAGLIMALAPRGRATPLALITLAAAYGLLYVTDQHLLPALATDGPTARSGLIVTGAFITLAHTSVIVVEYIRMKVWLLEE